MSNRSALYLLLCLPLCLPLAATAQSTVTDQWSWMSGSSTVPIVPNNTSGQPGVYGTLGTPAPGNIPGSRQGAVSWTDKSGNLWLFGGSGYDANGTFAFLNDLWEYQPSLGQWAWMGGSSTVPPAIPEDGGSPGLYGSLGVPSTANMPGSRTGAVAWTDKNGNLWLFGGAGIDSTGLSGNLNDLWEYIPSASTWTWMGGSSTLGSAEAVPGVYGTIGQPSASNVPGSRNFAVAWTDTDGNFWLFGGYGSDSVNSHGDLNDLWKYSPSSGRWTWISGSNIEPGGIGASGVYGTQGVPSSSNAPGAREAPVGWTTSDGSLWLFGGFGFMPDSEGFLNDLWKFDPATSQWTWISGSDTLPFGNNGNAGVYGTLNVPAATNVPGSRSSPVAWTDKNGKLWLYGGEGDDSTGSFIDFLSDLWVFDPSTLQWTWVGGNSQFSSSCVPFTTCGQAGAYGTLGVASPQNLPGSRESSVAWTDSSSNFWLFGGTGQDSLGTLGILNDLWEYQQPMVPAAPPSFDLAPGTYNTTQTVTLTDAMPNATIYYTTDGSAPTVSSTVYTVPITIDASQTVLAIAVAPGYSSSVAGASAYVIPPDFSLAASVSSASVSAGQSTSASINIAPLHGFSAPVTFACSGLPAGATCTFAPATINPSSAPLFTTLTIATTSTSAMLDPRPGSSWPASVLAFGFCFCLIRRRSTRLALRTLLPLAVVALLLTVGCGGASQTMTKPTAPATPQPTTSVVTVTATSGALQHTAQITLTIN